MIYNSFSTFYVICKNGKVYIIYCFVNILFKTSSYLIPYIIYSFD